MKKIDKNMTMAEIVAENPEAANKLTEMGIFCGGCPMAQFETIENGAMVHGIDIDEIIEELNEKS